MRENRTSGLMRGSNENGDSRPLLSTLLADLLIIDLFSVFPTFCLLESSRMRKITACPF